MEKFHLIGEAFAVLSDKEKRDAFDETYRAFLEKQRRDIEMDSVRKMYKEKVFVLFIY
jgi:DnaJ-class molecular chaperone